MILGFSLIRFGVSEAARTRASNGIEAWGRTVDARVEVFDPLQLNPIVWLDADDGVESDSIGTPADSGDAVVFWRDQSGYTNDAGQGTLANRPEYRTGVSGIGNCLTFDGIDGFLNATGNDTEGEFTYIAVFASSESSPSARNVLFGHKDAGYWGMFAMNYSSSRPFLYMASSNYRYWDDQSAQDDGDLHLLYLYIAGSSQSDIEKSELRFDGELAAVFQTVSTSSPPAWDSFEIGHYQFAENHYYGNYDLCLFGVISGKLSTYHRIALENWISHNKGTP